MVTQGKIMYWTSFKELAETPFESTVSIYPAAETQCQTF